MSSFETHKAHVITHAIIITLLPLSPVPLLDWFLEPIVARKLFEPFTTEHPSNKRHFIGRGGSFCLGCITSLLLYPITKFLKIVRFFLQFKTFVQTFYYWFYKAYIVHQAHILLSEECLSDHKKMYLLGQELDAWLRDSKTSLSAGVSSITNLAGMRRLVHEGMSKNPSSVDTLLQDTETLDSWLKSWATEHDSPQ